MKAIYTPKGKALEYGNLACNLYRGCGHRCSYCYAPAILRMDRQEFYNNPQPRKGIIEALRKDAKKIGDEHKEAMRVINSKYPLDHKGDMAEFCKNLGSIRKEYPERPEVFLCFTTDPYQPINEEYQLTRQAIEILHENEIAVNILTKGMITDFDLLAKRPDLSKVGVTFDGTENFAEKNLVRMKNLYLAKNDGIQTWVSLEPVIKPDSVLRFIKECNRGWRGKMVDLFKLGKWNYDKRANDIDWHKFVNEAIELLEKLGCKYYIKEDLRGYIK